MTTTREESEMETRAPDRSKCKPWCGEKNSELYCHAVESVFNGGAFADFDDPAFDETRWCTLACLDARLPPIQPPEPETWRGMRVGQRWKSPNGLRRVLEARDNAVMTTSISKGLPCESHIWWSKDAVDDMVYVESWTLVSDAGEAVPEKCKRPACKSTSTRIGGYCSRYCEKITPGPAAVPAKVCMGPCLHAGLALGPCAGPVLARYVGPQGTRPEARQFCEWHYLDMETHYAEKTPHTEPKKARPPRYPESNDIDQDIADA